MAGVIDTVAWVHLEDELAWFGYADRPRVPPVDQMLFDDLRVAGQLR